MNNSDLVAPQGSQMSRPTRDLPDFLHPPVIEVTLSAQFEPIVRLRTPHIGLFWSQLRSEFPVAEERPPLPPSIELFGRQPESEGLRVEVLQVPPVSRTWLLNQAGSELIQIQRDRFSVNWRKVSPDSEYPRYEHVREMLVGKLQQFNEFLQVEDLGEMKFTQCEVTYVNHFPAGTGWERPGQLGNLATVWTDRYSDQFLSEPEDIRFSVRYVMSADGGEPIGRLHINTEPRYTAASPALMMVLNARGKPLGPGIAGVIRFLDEGRKWIVRGFTSITTKRMHELWGRRDDR